MKDFVRELSGGPSILKQHRLHSIRQRTGAYREALVIISYIVLVAAIIPLIMRPPKSTAASARLSKQAA